ncbi:hypothetical protein JCM8202v2_000117 [Rhodotorula sphaerocarpa]
MSTASKGPSRSGFRPRQSNYLRISPTTVLQMILYLEPAHVEWMNNSVLERMLMALRDRIPLKLAQEGPGKAKGREKTQVDVFRGTDYQMAFFFRRSSDKHVVLLKHKHFYDPPPSQAGSQPQPQPQPGRPSGGQKRARSISVPMSGRRAASESVEPGGTGDGDGDDRPSKRRAGSTRAREPLFSGLPEGADDDDVVFVKDEPVEEDGLPPARDDQDGEARSGVGAGEENLGEVKLEDDEAMEAKPTLKSYRIFGRTLVVIVEPYPPLDPKDLARPLSGLTTEVRQLSASVAPDSYRRRSAAPGGGRSSISVTPAPAPGDRPGGSLFRREETEDAQSLRGSVTPSLAAYDTDREEEEEEDEQMRKLRATSVMLANEWPEAAEQQDGGPSSEADLPSLDDLVKRARGQGNVDGAGLDVPGDQPDGSI